MKIPILSILTFLPLAGALLFIFIPRDSKKLLRYLALAITLVTFLVSVPLYFQFDSQTADLQFV
jgi:NADH-quinone oxidoreductase subunit M